jgi:hypothetical protein
MGMRIDQTGHQNLTRCIKDRLIWIGAAKPSAGANIDDCLILHQHGTILYNHQMTEIAPALRATRKG